MKLTMMSVINSTGGYMNSKSHDINLSKMIIMMGVGLLFVIFGVMGNILVIVSVVRHRHLHSVPNYFVVNLAMSDLLLSCVVVPLSASLEVFEQWVWGGTLCDMWLSFDVFCCTVSFFTICVISMDRYLAISNPLRYPSRATPRRALGAVVAVWVLSTCISIGPLFGWKEQRTNDSVCEVNKNLSYVIFSNTTFYVALAVILFTYYKVYKEARRQMKNLKKLQCQWNSNTETLHIHSGITQQCQDETPSRSRRAIEKLRGLSREMKAAKTLAVVVGCFICCWLPFFIVLPISSFSKTPLELALTITSWFCYLNSCLNPIIYPCFSKDFRKVFHNVLKSCWLHRSIFSRAVPSSAPMSTNEP